MALKTDNGRKLQGYTYPSCRLLAREDLNSQRTHGQDVERTQQYMIANGDRVDRSQTGYCVFNADSLTFATLREFLP